MARRSAHERSSVDLVMNLMLGIFGLFAIVLLLVNVPAKEGEAKPPGQVNIEIFWDNARNTDVDLWVQGPGDKVVGYSTREGMLFNLVRDDLGTYRDLTPVNTELATSRGMVPGEYVANVHFFRDSVYKPIEVLLVVSVENQLNHKMVQIYATRVTLLYVGHELTVVRFRLDAHGALVPGSINAIPKVLRG